MALKATRAQLNEVLGSRLRDISARQFRELLLIIGPVLLLVAGAIWLALQFVDPAPPKRVTIATGGTTGAYYGFGARYAKELKKHGITLDFRATAGSVENVKLLGDDTSGVSVALVQGGIINRETAPKLNSLGRLFVEPLWVFYRHATPLDRLHLLKGRRIAIGPEGSGTRHLALALLAASNIDATTATLLPLSGKAAADALQKGEVDAVFLAMAPQSAVVQALLRDNGVRLMSFTQGDAYTRLFPYLERIVLPQGAIDLVANIPERDVTLIGPVAALVVRQDIHPALVGLLIDAAKEAHTQGGLFNRVGDFPRPLDPELELAEGAERYYKAGPSFLKRVLPFWLAEFIERMSLIAVPLAGIMLPLLKVGPWLYRWRINRRILYWYGRLKALESSAADDPEGLNLDWHREEISRIEDSVSTIPVPLAFAQSYYDLRSAIDLVRQRLTGRAVAQNAAIG